MIALIDAALAVILWLVVFYLFCGAAFLAIGIVAYLRSSHDKRDHTN